MNEKTRKMYEKINALLECETQTWFFGAGASFEAKVPLIYELTKLIDEKVVGEHKENYEIIKKHVGTRATIEDILNHISDFISLSQRSESKQITLDKTSMSVELLIELYRKIIASIGEIVRFGYDSETCEFGSIENPLIDIKNHSLFFSALKKVKKDRLTSHTFFTTNYDTLIEDGLSISQMDYKDGFLGGSIGFWRPDHSFIEKSSPEVFNIFKLHGSIDWYKENDILYRVRYGSKYLSSNENIIIYPQATKYAETAKNPFLNHMSHFREVLFQNKDNIMIFNGYGFGDEHINLEIKQALESTKSKTTFIITVKELLDGDGKSYLPKCLENWLKQPNMQKDRIYILTNKGIYHGDEQSLISEGEDDHSWWKFSSFTNDIVLGGAK